uniref:Polyketide synthase n=1 Tax=Denticeps clupeoides TaxID=299321 RepID=A0AAY4CMQ9_9TELE
MAILSQSCQGSTAGVTVSAPSNRENSFRSQCARLLQSQELVLAQVHPLDDVAAVVEDAADVLRVHGAGEVGVAVMAAVSAGGKLVSNEVLRSGHPGILNQSFFTIIWRGVAGKLGKVLFDPGLPCQNLLSQQVLLVEEQNDGDDVFEEIEGFLQAVGLIVLSVHIAGVGPTVETLDPFPPLVPLSPHVEHTANTHALKTPPGDADTHWKLTLSTWNLVSKMPDVRTLQRSRSWWEENRVQGCHFLFIPEQRAAKCILKL